MMSAARYAKVRQFRDRQKDGLRCMVDRLFKTEVRNDSETGAKMTRVACLRMLPSCISEEGDFPVLLRPHAIPEAREWASAQSAPSYPFEGPGREHWGSDSKQNNHGPTHVVSACCGQVRDLQDQSLDAEAGLCKGAVLVDVMRCDLVVISVLVT